MKVVVVGLGHAANWLHTPAIAQLTDARIVGGVDPDEDRRRQWALAHPASATSADLARMLSDTGADLVVVASPPHLHHEHCRTAIDAGCHVVCEKPFVETLEQADDLIHRAKEAKVHIAVNQEFRYMPIFAAVRAKVGAAGIGSAVFIHCTQFMDLPPWDEPVAWRAAMKNRSLFEGGVHLIDVVHSIAGRMPQRVTAHTSSGLALEREADAIHLVTLDYGDGLLAQVTIDRLCRSGTRYADLRVDCEHASLRASYGGRALVQIGVRRAQRPGIRVEFGPQGLAWIERGLRRRGLARNPRNATARGVGALYRDAIPRMLAGDEPLVSARTARDTLAIILAAYESAERGQTVSL